ncbi:MAG: hypothetical protein ACPG8W_14770 [Candidatus Promineifilaceae bacterium]
MEIAFFWELLKSVGALWLGAYILTRGGAHGRSQMAAMAMILWSLSPFSIAMATVSEDTNLRFWLRFLVGVWPITIGFFFGTAMSLVSDVLAVNWHPSWRARMRAFYQVVIVMGITLGCFAAFSDLVYDYSTVQNVSGHWIDNSFRRAGSAEPLYTFYRSFIPLLLIIVITWAMIQARRDQLPNARGLLFLMLSGWVWFAGLLLRRLLYSELITGNGFIYDNLADPAFVLALALLGWGMVQHNAIMRGRIVLRDFLLSMAGLIVIVLGFAVLPWLIARAMYPFEGPVTYFLLLVMTWIAVWTHMLIEIVRQRVDIVFVGDTAATVREEVADVMQANLEGVSLEETFDELDLIRKKAMVRETVNKQLLRALNSAEGQLQLAASPLQTLQIVQNGLSEHATDRQKASGILSLLEQGLERLSSAETNPSNRQQELLQILNLRLKDGLDRTDITQRMHLHPRKYDRLLTDGVAQLADAIFELELTEISAT